MNAHTTKKSLTVRKKTLTGEKMSCETIWLQLELAQAAKTVYFFTADLAQYFWFNCSALG